MKDAAISLSRELCACFLHAQDSLAYIEACSFNVSESLPYFYSIILKNSFITPLAMWTNSDHTVLCIGTARKLHCLARCS